MAKQAVTRRGPAEEIEAIDQLANDALGGGNEPPDTKKIAALLREPDGFKRKAATEALSKLGSSSVLAKELVPLLSDQDCRVRRAAGTTLGKLGPTAAPYATAALRAAENRETQIAAADALSRMGDEAIESVAELLSDNSEGVRAAGVFGMTYGAKRGGTAAKEFLELLNEDSNAAVKKAASRALFLGGAASETKNHFLGCRTKVRCAAVAALSALGPKGESAVAHHLDDPDGEVRREAADNLRKAYESRAPGAAAGALVTLTNQLGDSNGRARKAAAKALGTAGEEGARLAFARLDDSDWRVRRAAQGAMAIAGAALPTKNAQEISREGLGRGPYHPSGDKALVPNELCGLLSHGDHEVRAAAARALAESASVASSHHHDVAKLLGDNEKSVREAAAGMLSNAGEEGAQAAAAVLSDPNADATKREEAINVLASRGVGGSSESAVASLLTNRAGLKPSIAAGAAGSALIRAGGLSPSVVASALAQHLVDSEASVRISVTKALGLCGNDAAPYSSKLIELRETDEDHEVRAAAAEAIPRISPSFTPPTGKSLLLEGLESGKLESTIQEIKLQTKTKLTQAAAVLSPRGKSLLLEGLESGKLESTIQEIKLQTKTSVTQAAAVAGGNDPAAHWAVTLLVDPSALPAHHVRIQAAEAIGRMGEDGMKHAQSVAVLLRDHDAHTRRAAAEALGKLRGGLHRAAHANAVASLLTDADSGVRAAAATALGQMGIDGATHAKGIAALLKDNQRHVRKSAGVALGQLNGAGATNAASLLTHPRVDVRIAVAEAFREMGLHAVQYVAGVVNLLADNEPAVRKAAADALLAMGSAGAPQAVNLLEHPESYVRVAAATALGCMGSAGADGAASLVKHSESRVREAALLALGLMGPAAGSHAATIAEAAAVHDAGPRSAGSSQDRWYVRCEAARCLGRLGAAGSIYSPIVVQLLCDRKSEVRAAAATALGEMMIHSKTS